MKHVGLYLLFLMIFFVGSGNFGRDFHVLPTILKFLRTSGYLFDSYLSPLSVPSSFLSPPSVISENFNSTCPSGLPDGWTAISRSGNQSWSCSTFGKPDSENRSGSAPFGLQFNGFDGVPRHNESWLISPAYDLTDFDYPILSFWSRTAFSGPRLELVASTDYSWGNPGLATWKNINDWFAKEDLWTFSGEINLTQFKSNTVTLAFVYYSSPEQGAARWTLDDFNIKNAQEPPAPFLSTTLSNTDYFHFGIVPLGQTSPESKSFDFSLSDGNHQLTISGSQGFEFSKEGDHFSPSLNYSAEEAAQNNTLHIRFAPESNGGFAGPIVFEYGEVLERKSFLTGSTVKKDLTFDLVTWNIAWFGSSVPFQGPANIELQLENVKNILEALDADVYALQEITDLSKFQELVASLEDYEAVVSPAASYGQENYETAQKLAFLYKSATVKLIKTRVLLEGVLPENLEGYPSEAHRFWASGRLPYLMEVTTTINGQEQNITLVNMHTRSNGGGESSTHPRYAMRRFDVKVLKDTIDKYYGEEPLILLGDFNDDLDETVADQNAATVNTTETSFLDFMLDPENYFPVTLSLSEAGLRTFLSFENVIDHMILSNELTESQIKNTERIVAPFDMVQNYQNTTSDHLPVKIRLDLNKVVEKNPILGLPASRTNAVRVRVFPNPGNKTVHVLLENIEGTTQVALRNLLGKTIQKKVTDKGKAEFDVSSLSRGTYLIIGTGPDHPPFVERIIVK